MPREFVPRYSHPNWARTKPAVMHSEDPAVHEIFDQLLRKRRTDCQTDEEVKAWELLAEFEKKHCAFAPSQSLTLKPSLNAQMT